METAPVKSPRKSCRRPSMEQEGGDGKESASLQCTGKWKIKSITARGKMRGRTECLMWYALFHAKKASQMSVRPFLRGLNDVFIMSQLYDRSNRRYNDIN